MFSTSRPKAPIQLGEQTVRHRHVRCIADDDGGQALQGPVAAFAAFLDTSSHTRHTTSFNAPGVQAQHADSGQKQYPTPSVYHKCSRHGLNPTAGLMAGRAAPGRSAWNPELRHRLAGARTGRVIIRKQRKLYSQCWFHSRAAHEPLLSGSVDCCQSW